MTCHLMYSQTSFLVTTQDAFEQRSAKVQTALKCNVPIVSLSLFEMLFERDDFDMADLKAAPELWFYDPTHSKVSPF